MIKMLLYLFLDATKLVRFLAIRDLKHRVYSVVYIGFTEAIVARFNLAALSEISQSWVSPWQILFCSRLYTYILMESF